MIPTLAAIRFGTGLSPDHAVPVGADDVLADLAAVDSGTRAFPVETWAKRADLIRQWGPARRARNDSEAAAEAFRVVNRELANGYHRDLVQAMRRASAASVGFGERLAWFWSGHFAVTDGTGWLRRNLGSYHDEALRPHLAGSFADLLISAVTHPAMLAYLDQDKSIGPNSVRGRRGGGLNENLAREVLELHTLGVGGGYSQTDVRQLAELLTGLGIDKSGEMVFRRNHVEPGAETVLDRSYGGETPNRHDIVAVLTDLSVHPATAMHLSTKLARHFVADEPDADLVRAMAQTWLQTDGNLRAVYSAMLDHPAAWSPVLQKVRQPLDMVAAALRVTGTAERLAGERLGFVRQNLTTPLLRMGQPWLRPPGPDGWREEAEAWITPQGLAARIEWIMALAGWLDPKPDPRGFVDAALGELASARTRFAAQAAEERTAGISLVLSSPEFQRR